MAERPNIIVVGAGVIGASIAWHLARRGAAVTIVEAGEPGGIATRNSWAWINASMSQSQAYFQLRASAMADWRRLERELPDLRVDWTGSLNWELPADRLAALARRLSGWGYDIRCVDGDEARRLEPALRQLPALALHAPGEGAVEPAAAMHLLLGSAKALGVRMIVGEPVSSIAVRRGHATGVTTRAGRYDGDWTIVAAGSATPAIVATAGLDLAIADPAALLVGTRPCRRVLRGLVMTPELQLRQARDGRFMAAASLAGTDLAGTASRTFAALADLFDPPFSVEPDFHLVGRRPIPGDGLPLVGRADEVAHLYVATTHSGITLAPLIGRLVADEIVSDRCDALLAPFGLERTRRI